MTKPLTREEREEMRNHAKDYGLPWLLNLLDTCDWQDGEITRLREALIYIRDNFDIEPNGLKALKAIEWALNPEKGDR